MMASPAHHRLFRSIRDARGAGLAEIEALLAGTRGDWAEAWEAFRANAYRGEAPYPDIARLIRAADLFDAAGASAAAAFARETVARIEAEKDEAACRASNLARQAYKPGGAAGRINRTVGHAGFAELSQPTGDR
jgi:hypothetical protein